MEEKSILMWWFISVSWITLGVMYAVEYESSLIILNIFVAPISLLTYCLFEMCKDAYDKLNEKDKK